MTNGWLCLNHVEQLPIPILDISIEANKIKRDNLVSLASKMLELKQKEAAEQNQQAKTMISRQIEGVDKAIDAEVYALYGIAGVEVEVVEG